MLHFYLSWKREPPIEALIIWSIWYIEITYLRKIQGSSAIGDAHGNAIYESSSHERRQAGGKDLKQSTTDGDNVRHQHGPFSAKAEIQGRCCETSENRTDQRDREYNILVVGG